ncbi:hypothetical protein [Seonamhaeicola maritimus]|uniref:hypothetical protein n=1 Tax=Seonamhaeicola maritimus TaxID=2591822 RepID=UPI0024943D69|nr:hypothetical protein [Seonamhaeicola maritimus]
MLTDKQSLILCGLMAGGIFIAGVLDILDNFVILTLLTIIFLAIILNLVATRSFEKKEEELEE